MVLHAGADEDTHISVTATGKFMISDLGHFRHMEFLFCTSAAAVALGAAAYGAYAVTAAEARKVADDDPPESECTSDEN